MMAPGLANLAGFRPEGPRRPTTSSAAETASQMQTEACNRLGTGYKE